jgi:hypothetical protein
MSAEGFAEYSDEDLKSVFFDSADILKQIREDARMGMIAPWSLFGSVLTFAMANIPPEYQIPRIVGTTPGSLNFFAAQVGDPGGGKGLADNAGRLLLGCPMEIHPASGEGLARVFHVEEDKEPNRQAIATFPEVKSLIATATRGGSTIMSQLTKAWSGEALGQQTSDRSRTYNVPWLGYRFCMTVGVQPEAAGPIFAQEGTGLPQRFLWVHTEDEHAEIAPRAERQRYRPQRYELAGLTTGQVSYPDVAWEIAESARRARLLRETHRIDGHALMTRLKLAAGIAYLTGQTSNGLADSVDLDVTGSVWDLSGIAMEISNRTRARCRADMSRYAAVQERETGIRRGNVLAHQGESQRNTEAEILESKKDKVLSFIKDTSEKVTIRDIARKFHWTTKVSAPVCQSLLEDGLIEEQPAGRTSYLVQVQG